MKLKKHATTAALPFMTTMPVATDSLGGELLAEVAQQISAAEQRRDQQIDVVADLHEGTEARAFAEHALAEIERTLSLNRAQHALIQNLLK